MPLAKNSQRKFGGAVVILTVLFLVAVSAFFGDPAAFAVSGILFLAATILIIFEKLKK